MNKIIIFISIISLIIVTFVVYLKTNIFYASGNGFSCATGQEKKMVNFDTLILLSLIFSCIELFFFGAACMSEIIYSYNAKTFSSLFIGIGLILVTINIIFSSILLNTLINRTSCTNTGQTINSTEVNKFVMELQASLVFSSSLFIILFGTIIYLFFQFSQ